MSKNCFKTYMVIVLISVITYAETSYVLLVKLIIIRQPHLILFTIMRFIKKTLKHTTQSHS